MTYEEHETHICYDYAAGTVRIFTTREGVVNGLTRRLGNMVDYSLAENASENGKTWNVVLPLETCRSPEMLVPLLNPELKTKMPESVKAKFRS